ncbi:MAG: glycosyltransferase family 4 protein [Patescibacteria group bacterium]|nr:glycosyltransferase family 4 protein [Patescibacteria group bacterium]
MENRKFKIALFMLPLLTQGGGAEKYFINLARNFSKRGYETDIITMDENFFRRFARVLHIFALGNFLGKIDTGGRENEEAVEKQLDEARWIKASTKNLRNILGNYDVIYAKNELVDLALLKFIGYKKLPPIIVGVHTPVFYPGTKSFISRLHNFLYLSFFYKWLLKGTKCIHVSNKFTKSIIRGKLNIESKLVYYPFSVKNITDLANKNISNINFSAEKKNIIFSGRLGEQKGIDILINIIERINENTNLRDKVCVNIFGSGDKEYESEIRSLAEKFSFVKYFGHVENKFMPYILSQQDLMVAPSKWETLPYAILEAQGMGVPVVAFDIPGPGDIIEDRRTGILAKDENEFLEAIKNFVDGKVIFDKSCIIANIRKKFDPGKIYSELIKMFQEVLCKN